MIEISSPPIVYDNVGRCIYCGAVNDDLRREHIIPFGLGGNAILPSASCRACETITGRLEQFALRGMLGPLRMRLGLPTRNKKERPQELSIDIINLDGTHETHNIAISEYPQFLVTFRMPPPGILSGRPLEKTITLEPRFITSRRPDEEDINWRASTKVSPWAFLRMLAKIAHSFSVAQLGWDRFSEFTPLLNHIILETSDYVSHVIGYIGDAETTGSELHWLNSNSVIQNDTEYLIVDISLFTMMKAPIFRVVVGERKTPTSPPSHP